jgi:hypothetical protein
MSFHANVGAEVRHLHDNLPDPLNLPTFVLGIVRTCRVQNALIGKRFEIPSLIMSVSPWPPKTIETT